MTVSTALASAAGLAAILAPASTSGFAFSAERFHTVTCVADLDQPRRHRGPHPAETGNSDMHGLLPIMTPLFHPVGDLLQAASARPSSTVPGAAAMPTIGSLPATSALDVTIGENGD